jgi:hypothetical protein
MTEDLYVMRHAFAEVATALGFPVTFMALGIACVLVAVLRRHGWF